MMSSHWMLVCLSALLWIHSLKAWRAHYADGAIDAAGAEVVQVSTQLKQSFNEEHVLIGIDSKRWKRIRLRLKRNGFLLTPSFKRNSLFFSPEVAEDCYFQGVVRGAKDSAVSFSDCVASSALIEFENATLWLQPQGKGTGLLRQLELAKTVEHKEEQQNATDGPPPPPMDQFPVDRSSAKDQRSVELVVLVHQHLLEVSPSNTSHVSSLPLQNLIVLLNHMDTMFRASLSVRVRLRRLEKFSTAFASREQVIRWMSAIGHPIRSFDAAIVLQSAPVSATLRGPLCSPQSVIFAASSSLSDPSLLASMSASLRHLLTDDCGQEGCPREGKPCLQFNFALGGHERSHVSEVVSESCGDGRIDPGEECDCAKKDQQCRRCCDMSRCRLRPGAECTNGACCDTCKLRERGSICRAAVEGGCDVEEKCDGINAECPPEDHVHDGQPCDDGFCVYGRCGSTRAQCVLLWGPSADIAEPACFDKLADESLCGGLLCQGGADSPILSGTPPYAITTLVHSGRKFHCKYLQPGSGWALAFVPDGARCGVHSLCFNRTCSPVDHVFPRPACFADLRTGLPCAGRGRCSALGHCLCYPGWSGPQCQQPDSSAGAVESAPTSMPLERLLAVLAGAVALLAILFAGAMLGCRRTARTNCWCCCAKGDHRRTRPKTACDSPAPLARLVSAQDEPIQEEEVSLQKVHVVESLRSAPKKGILKKYEPLPLEEDDPAALLEMFKHRVFQSSQYRFQSPRRTGSRAASERAAFSASEGARGSPYLRDDHRSDSEVHGGHRVRRSHRHRARLHEIRQGDTLTRKREIKSDSAPATATVPPARAPPLTSQSPVSPLRLPSEASDDIDAEIRSILHALNAANSQPNFFEQRPQGKEQEPANNGPPSPPSQEGTVTTDSGFNDAAPARDEESVTLKRHSYARAIHDDVK